MAKRNEYYDRVRPDILDALDAWGEDGRPVGDFLHAVLTNDLFCAIGRADDENITTMREICSYVFMSLPSPCWGSEAKVEAWRKEHPYPRPVRPEPA